jgi:histidinol-phosphate aminotransferase
LALIASRTQINAHQLSFLEKMAHQHLFLTTKRAEFGMYLSRRKFLTTLGAGAAASAGVPLPYAAFSRAAFEPSRWNSTPATIRLNSNENVYGPCAKALGAIRSAESTVNRYPFMEYDDLVDTIAAIHQVERDQVVVGCGSTEILRVAAMSFLGEGKRLVQASPTFEAMDHYARSTGAEIISLPLNKEFAHDLRGMLAQVDAATTLIYLCNPNNPTGSITPRSDLENFISKLPANCYVLIDEAYHHFVRPSDKYASFLDHPAANGRVIVSRTFSKVYGLAGLRLGYGVAEAGVAQRLSSYLTQDSVNGLVVKAAIAALADDASVREFVQRNAAVRQEFLHEATERNLKPIDSEANFVMMDAKVPAPAVIDHFRRKNILIGRRFPPLETYVRISLGTPAEMQSFWRVWDRLPRVEAGRMQLS